MVHVVTQLLLLLLLLLATTITNYYYYYYNYYYYYYYYCIPLRRGFDSSHRWFTRIELGEVHLRLSRTIECRDTHWP